MGNTAQQNMNPYMNQNMAAQQYSAMLGQQYNINRQTYNWVWDGKPVTITEFAELAYGDTPQRTMFLLKHSDKKEK